MLVHVCRADHPVLVSNKHQLVHLLGTLHHKGCEVLHVHAHIHPLPHFQACGVVLAEKVTHLLLVDLQIRDPHEKLHSFSALGYVAEYVSEGIGNDSSQLRHFLLAGHRESLSRAGLAVREYGSVVAFKHGIRDGARRFVVHIRLLRVGTEHGVEEEGAFPLLLGPRVRHVHRDLAAQLVDGHDGFVFSRLLVVRERTTTNCYPHTLYFLARHIVY